MHLDVFEEVVEDEFLLVKGIGGDDRLESECGGIVLESDKTFDQIGVALCGDFLSLKYFYFFDCQN